MHNKQLSMAQYLVNLKFSFSTTAKLVIIRHGQSIWNKHRKWAGWSDVRLSSTGIKQAKQCGKLLHEKGFTFDQAYCSLLTRSIQTLNHVLSQLDLHYVPVHKDWRINEKHYGSLTGESKVETTQKFGEQKVADWRRSFEIAPPAVDIHDQRHPSKDKRYSHIDSKQLPASQNQMDVTNRLKPLWESEMRRKLVEGKNLLVSAHGGSARALAKIIYDLPNEQVKQLNLPHAVPLVFTFQVAEDKTLSVKSMQFIGDLQEITAKMNKIKNQNKVSSI